MSNSPNIIQQTHQMLEYSLPVLSRFPKNQKFILADRIEKLMLDILEKLVEAYYSAPSKKADILQATNLKIEVCRHLVRLSRNMNYISIQQYENITKSTYEIGKQLGAWLKSLQK